MKCKTPEIPAECQMDTDGDDDEEEVEDDEEGEQDNADEDKQTVRVTSNDRGSAWTAGKGAKNAESAHHKLSTVQCVKSN